LKSLKHHLFVLLATVLVAGSFLASEKLAGVINSFSLTLLRFSGAALLLLPFILLNKSKRSAVLRTLPRAAVISFFYAAYFIGFFQSLTLTSSLNTGTIFTLLPFITALLSLVIFREKITSSQLVAYLLGIIGTCWVILGGQQGGLNSFAFNQGDLIFLASVIFMCLFSISMKLLYRNDDMTVLVFCTLVCGSLWMALALAYSGQDLDWNLIQGDAIFNMAYLIIAATLVTSYLYQTTTIALGPKRVNAYVYLNPALVAMLLFMLDNKHIPIQVLPGIALSTLATLYLQYDINKQKLR